VFFFGSCGLSGGGRSVAFPGRRRGPGRRGMAVFRPAAHVGVRCGRGEVAFIASLKPWRPPRRPRWSHRVNIALLRSHAAIRPEAILPPRKVWKAMANFQRSLPASCLFAIGGHRQQPAAIRSGTDPRSCSAAKLRHNIPCFSPLTTIGTQSMTDVCRNRDDRVNGRCEKAAAAAQVVSGAGAALLRAHWKES